MKLRLGGEDGHTTREGASRRAGRPGAPADRASSSPGLFDRVSDAVDDDGAGRRETLAEAFARFHAENPHVLDKLITLTDQARAAGITRWGIARLFEKLRWDHAIETQGEDFRLNNNFRSFYVRLIEETRPDLVGFFEKRVSAADAAA